VLWLVGRRNGNKELSSDLFSPVKQSAALSPPARGHCYFSLFSQDDFPSLIILICFSSDSQLSLSHSSPYVSSGFFFLYSYYVKENKLYFLTINTRLPIMFPFSFSSINNYNSYKYSWSNRFFSIWMYLFSLCILFKFSKFHLNCYLQNHLLFYIINI
jgi:hypothetical protein